MAKKLSYEFVKEQIEKTGYKLLSREYKNANEKLLVKCPQGHEYNTIYNNFRKGHGCSKCNRVKKHSYLYIKEQIEQEGYELLSKSYKNARSKLKIKCNNGHEYEATYNDFQQGNRCPIERYKKSSNTQRYSHLYIKNNIKQTGYELLSKKYKNNRQKLLVRCPHGHKYQVRFENFQQGRRCPICSNRISKAEKELVEYLMSLNLEVIENDRTIISPLELDIVIPSHKIAIEYCGLYWHSELYKDKNYHLNKLEQCKEKGYKLITIFEDEWINKKEIVKRRLKYILGLETEKIYARNCKIKEISKEQASKFLNKYHIQGYINSSICLGAFLDKLVAVMTLMERNSSYELNRFCSSTNTVGIASKLFSYFQKKYNNYEEIYSFADRRWSNGNLYKIIGMKKNKTLYPDYSYFKYNGEIIRFHKFGFRHKQLKNKLEDYNPQLSERENMMNNNWLRIYDCGKIRYNYINNIVNTF